MELVRTFQVWHRANTVICNYCKDKVHTSDGNTTSPLNQLNRKHPEMYAVTGPHMNVLAITTQPVATKQRALLTFEKGTPYDRTGRRWKDVTDAVTFLIPIKTGRWVKVLLKIFILRFKIPAANIFLTDIPLLFECLDKIKHKIQNIQFFATAAELRSSHTSEPHLSLTLHFIHNLSVSFSNMFCCCLVRLTSIRSKHS